MLNCLIITQDCKGETLIKKQTQQLVKKHVDLGYRYAYFHKFKKGMCVFSHFTLEFYTDCFKVVECVFAWTSKLTY